MRTARQSSVLARSLPVMSQPSDQHGHSGAGAGQDREGPDQRTIPSGTSYGTLTRAGRLLEAAGDGTEVLRCLAQVAASTIADLTLVLGCDGTGGLATVAAAARIDGRVAAHAAQVALAPSAEATAHTPEVIARVLDASDRAVVSAADVAQVVESTRLDAVADLYGAIAPTAMVGFPLLFRGRRLGVVLAGYRARGSEFSPEQLDFLEALAERSAAAAEHARLQQVQHAARRKAELAETRSKQLQRATAALAKASTPEQVAEVAVRQARAALAAARGRLVRHGHADGAGAVIYEYDGAAPVAGAREANGRAGAAEIVRLREPLVAGDATLGVLELDFDSAHAADADERALLRSLARETGAALARAELTQAERAARAEAESASRAKSDFLAIMSHELRTPLSAIIGYASLLADGITGDITDAQRQQLTRITASARHLLAMIEDVLHYTQLEARSAYPELQRVDVAAVVREAANMIEPIVGPQGLTLDVGLPAGSLETESDPRHVRQILLNLLANAVKFTPPGGRVSVRAEESHGDIELAVADTGIGIAPEHHARIFEPFHQVDQRYSRRVGGVGVGLSIVRHLARGLGADVVVDSALGRGTTFIVRLPRVPSAAMPGLRPGAAAS